MYKTSTTEKTKNGKKRYLKVFGVNWGDHKKESSYFFLSASSYRLII